MDPILGLIGSIGGGLINNLFAGNRQEEAQKFAQQQAQQAEATFRTNRQTAYQDTMSDMQSAGLNPILAYQRGATGSTMGATPSPSAAPVSDVGIGSGVNSAVAMRTANETVENLKATREKTQAETAATNEHTANLAADTKLKTLAVSPAVQKALESEPVQKLLQTPEGKLLIQSGYIGNAANTALSPVWSGIGALTKIPFTASSAKSADRVNFGVGNPVGDWGGQSANSNRFKNRFDPAITNFFGR